MWAASSLGSASSFSAAGLPSGLSSGLSGGSTLRAGGSLSGSVEPSPSPSSTPFEPTPTPEPVAETSATCGVTPDVPCWVATDPATTAVLGVGLAALVMLSAAGLFLGLRR